MAQSPDAVGPGHTMVLDLRLPQLTVSCRCTTHSCKNQQQQDYPSNKTNKPRETDRPVCLNLHCFLSDMPVDASVLSESYMPTSQCYQIRSGCSPLEKSILKREVNVSRKGKIALIRTPQSGEIPDPQKSSPKVLLGHECCLREREDLS